MKRILTPDEYIIRNVNEHPSLYASDSYKETRFRILDHTFNVIGNGIRMADFIGEPVTEEEIQAAQKWFKCKKASYGYMAVRTFGKGKSGFVMPEGDPVCVVPIKERKNHPDVKCWIDFDCDTPRDPYPNFSKQYSLVWDKGDVQFEKLGPEWAKAAGDFYNECRDYFMDSERVLGYHEAFPNTDEGETARILDSYKGFIGDTKKYPTNEDISNAYECEFKGDRTNDDDVINFIMDRWDIQHQKILDFIFETIRYMNTLIIKKETV